MKIKNFKLERLFARYEDKAKYMLSQVACEAFSMKEILELADDECRGYWDNLSLGYPPLDGFPPLKEAIAARYTSIRPHDVMEVAPEEGIFIFLNNLLEPGDEVITVHPTLPSLYEIPRAIGCKIIKWPLEVTNWGWHLDINFLLENISPKTKLLILNFPNNPTGYIPVRTELERIINIADRNGTWIFNEETYRGMEHDPGALLPSVADIYHRAAAVGGLNKYGLPGTRIGWLISKDRQLLTDCCAYKDYTSLVNSATSEILATIAMRNADDLLKRNHEIVLANLSLAETFFKKHKNLFQWTQPNGGAIAFPRLLPPYDVTEMCEHAIIAHNIMIIGERAYGLTTNHFRVGLGRRDFAMALTAFSQMCDELQEKIKQQN